MRRGRSSRTVVTEGLEGFQESSGHFNLLDAWKVGVVKAASLVCKTMRHQHSHLACAVGMSHRRWVHRHHVLAVRRGSEDADVVLRRYGGARGGRAIAAGGLAVLVGRTAAEDTAEDAAEIAPLAELAAVSGDTADAAR